MSKHEANQPPHIRFFSPLQAFAEQLTKKYSAHAAGEPEDQLKPPTDQLFSAFGKIISQDIVLKGESKLHGRLGRPDFAAHIGQLPIGYIELKAPGKGANPELYKRHDRDQWKRFQDTPNLIYTDGNEWALYQEGKLYGKRVRLDGDVRTDGKTAAGEANAKALFHIFARFTSWQPIIPTKPKALAGFLAPFCRLIREEVMDALADSGSPMHNLKDEIKKLLFPDADDMRFADAYAQTVIFALLLAQMEGANVLDLRNAYDKLEQHHSLLSRTLEFLTDKQARTEISEPLSMAQRVIHEIPSEMLKGKKGASDPWLFFYEDFLAVYDHKLRKEAGVYYTPLEIVRCQVHLIDEILREHLGKEMGFVEPGVTTLDPAVGTGTYLLGIIDHALQRVAKAEGPGAVKGGARSLVNNLHGFEWMVGPYAVAQLRFSQALTTHGISLPPTGPGIYLTNTLESPHIKPPVPPLFHKPIAQEHERALKIKDAETVLVSLGNPPYGRHAAITDNNHATTGGWVRHGAPKDPAKPILEDFLEPARKAGYGGHLKNLYNLYVYFIRWSLWKVFEHKTATGPGVLSFITCSSYMEGDAFAGLREHMRRVCDHIDIIDLGGEGRGARKSDNVFAIQTPVAIYVAWRKGKSNPNIPATVRYARIEGSREEKLQKLSAIREFSNLNWKDCPDDWQAIFRPAGVGKYFDWPLLTDLFPWHRSGVTPGRTWPIASDSDILTRCWRVLCNAEKNQRDQLFKNSPTGRKTHDKISQLPPLYDKLKAISDLPKNTSPPGIVRYAYRSFDRQYLFADARMLDRPGPSLWYVHSERQIYLTSLFNLPLGFGPALTACCHIPDRHHFSGRGSKDTIPLYRDAKGKEANITAGLLDVLGEVLKLEISPEDFMAYVYGLLAQPAFTERFADELEKRQVRLPVTKDSALFAKVRDTGRKLLWLHTYGERMTAADRPSGKIPKGSAKCVKAVSDTEDEYPNEFRHEQATQTLHVGDGTFGPVSPEVWEFEVSGLKVVKSWLGYRMRDRSGKKSSPLDDIRPKTWTYEFTRELLELLWVLEATVKGYPEQKKLLEAILAGELFTADELPPVTDEERKAPKIPKPSKGRSLF